MSFFDDIGHSIKKGADKLGDGAEDLYDEGRKKLGEGVNWVAHRAGDGLDKLGFHDAANVADDLGDEFASGMGAHVDEKELGRTEDPDQLLHGNVGNIRRTASHLKDFSAAFDGVGKGMTGLDPGHWRGAGADAFREKFAMHPRQWAYAADACGNASKALETYAETVAWAKERAKEAIGLYKAGKEAQKKAFDTYKANVDAYNRAADAYNAALRQGHDPGTPPVPPGECPNAGADKMREAQELLTDARKQRDAAAATAVAAVKGALKDAPQKPAFTDRARMDLADARTIGAVEGTHFLGGVAKGATGLVKSARTVLPLDPYNVTHPAQYATHLNNLAAGMVTLANHPGRAPAMLLGDQWGKDNAEASGRFGFDAFSALATDGGSLGAAAGRRMAVNSATKGAEELAGRGAGRAATSAEREAGEAGGTSAARAQHEENPSSAGQSDQQKPCGNTDPIDLATGHMFLSQTDAHLPGALPLAFSRRVGSAYRAGRWLGPSWTSTADQRLEIDPEGVVLVCEDGRLLAYPHPAPGVPTLPTHGPRWSLEIDAGGSYTVTDPLTGLTRHFAPPGGHPARHGTALLEQITDRAGRWITYEYDADGTPLALAHHAGRRIRITTEADRITALHLVGAGPGETDVELIRYGYTDGDLTEVVNSSGTPLRFTYDERHRMTAWTDRNGRGYRYAYDDHDRCVFQTGTEGHLRHTFEYGAPDPATGLRVTAVTDSLGHTSRYTFNDRSQLVAETDPNGATTLSRWDRRDRLLSRTDPLGRTAEFRYDGDGRLTAVVRPDGREATASHDGRGLPLEITGPDGTVWRHTYDADGNRVSTTDPTGAVTRYAYDANGHPSSVTDALGNTTRLRCDRAGLPVETVDPLGGVTTYRRDAFGRVTAVTDPLGATTRMRWSVEGRLLQRVEPDGSEQSWTYDGEGNCTTHTDAIGGVTRYEYTHFDLLAARTGPDGVRHEFTHDTQLRLRQVTNPQGLIWSYDYDPAGRLRSETDFDGRTLAYTHDAAGRLTARTNALGQTIAYEHDVLGRVVAKNADGAVTTYAHDAAGRLLEAAGPDATVVYGRDRLGRVKSETTDGRTLTFAYDRLGRRTRRVTPAGAVSTWTYDAASRRTSLTASGRVFDIEHDAAGREIARHFGDGLTLSHEWDAAGRVTAQSLTLSGASLQRRDYTYRRDGYLTAVNDRSFELDAVGRVTAVTAPDWQERYAYDETGNQTEAAWPTGHPGAEAQGPRAYTGTRLTHAGNVRYEHDAQGRVVLRQKTRLSRKPDTWRYAWDAEDRLTSVTTPDGTCWRYVYDPLGRRIAKRRLTPTGETAEEVTFTWDGPTLTEQTTTSADLPDPVTLTWDHDGLRPVSQTERISAADAPQREIDSRFFAIVTDLIGAPTELVDESGTTAWRTRATVWGTTTWSRTSTAYTPLRFPGQYFDPETGLHYNFHRHYDPETARYLSPDPMGLEPAPNPVAYVHNPCTWADPLGLAPEGCPRGGADGPANAANGERLRQQLREEAGPVGSIQGIEDIMENPQILSGGVLPEEVRGALIGERGWREETLGRGGHAGQGWVLREYTEGGEPTGRMLRWHPGGGHHGDGAYWRVKGWEGDLGGVIR
ncbi:putative T7SS-secreted protein [Streptomyces sp. NPDC049577]|uniref:putative T7SS-secreted protein n=1 Tax=Streptomyces sp. NPDC049577 TaxID=3155153 RepID=UPI003439C2B2